MPSSTPRGGTPRPRRASSPSAPSSRPEPGRRVPRRPDRRPERPAAPRTTSAQGARREAAEPPRRGATSGAAQVAQGPAGGAAWPTSRWWVLGLIVVVLAVMIVPTVRRYVDQQAQIAALREHVTTQQGVVDDLARRRARWDDPAYVEQQARERLHFVKSGETGYTLTRRQDGAAARTDSQVVGVDAADAALPWYGKLWGSLDAADRLGDQVRRTPAP